MAQRKLLIRPQKTPLTGTITVPSDKSISHRAVMFGALASGTSVAHNWLPAGDTIATLEAVRSLGVPIHVEKNSPTQWTLTIEGQGMHGLKPSNAPLNFVNAGTGIRLMAGIMAGQRFPSVLDGSEQLRKRPMRRITNPLSEMGANIRTTDGKAPLQVQPAPLHGIQYEMPVASAQVKSAALLAGLFAEGETRIHQPGPARDHTERMLEAVGVSLRMEGNWVILPAGEKEIRPFSLTVPADISSAAFPIVAATIVPHSNITLQGIGLNETRTGILDMLRTMGANFSVSNETVSGGEPIADLTVQFDELHSTKLGGETVVRGIDELPIWSIAATQAAGSSTVRDAGELRVKEVDRIGVLLGELRKMGITPTEYEDGFTIDGPVRLYSAEVDSHDDHRLGMAFAIAGLVTRGETLIHNADCIADSFPGFVETMQSLGTRMEWVA